jgi:hypothetical protein
MAGLVHVFLTLDAGISPGMTKKRNTSRVEKYRLVVALQAGVEAVGRVAVAGWRSARGLPPGRFIYALLFVRMPLNDAGTVSGSFPSLCTAAKMAAMYPYGPRPQMTAVEALDVIECRCSSSLA